MQVFASSLRRSLVGLALCSLCTGAAFPRSSDTMLFPSPAEVRVERTDPATSLGALEADLPLLWIASDVTRFLHQQGHLESFPVEELEAYLRQQHPGVERVTGDDPEYRYVILNGELFRICYVPMEILIRGEGGSPVALRFELSMPV